MTSDSMNRFEQEHLKRWRKSVIPPFATLQNSCLACRQDFRKVFVEHFYGQH